MKAQISTTVETTSETAAAVKYKKKWLLLRPKSEWSITPDRTWVFCDGSTTGWHSAVIIQPNHTIRRVARFEDPTSSANVGAEINGLLLGLEYVDAGSQVTVVHDYLGVGAWLTGSWKIEKPDVRKRVDTARSLIESKALNISFIHHGGHQKDSSDFTKWNNVADKLCSGKRAYDSVESL